MSFSLEELLVINQGDIATNEFRTGRSIEIWLKEDNSKVRELLFPERDKPGRYELIVTEDAPTASHVIKMRSRYPVTLQRNDVVMFESGKKIIIKSKTELFGYFNEPSEIPIYSSEEEIEIGEQSNTYGMLPLFSAKEGGFPQVSVTYAEAHNKNQGLYPVFQKVKDDATVTISGDINFNDPCLSLLKNIKKGFINKLFVQVRHGVDNGQFGEGYFACEYWAIPYLALSDTESTFINFSLELKVVGKVQPYEIITGPFGTRYCPQKTISPDIYFIPFDLSVRPFDVAQYCPQNTTGFYDFATAP